MSGTRTLVSRHLRQGAGASLLVGLLVAVAVLAVAVAPRALSRLGSAELRHSLGERSATELDLSATGRLGLAAGIPDATAGELLGDTDRAIRGLTAELPEPLRAAAGRPQWVVRSAGTTAGPTDAGASVVLRLAVDLSWKSRIRLVDGAFPTRWTGHESAVEPGGQPPIGIAMSRTSADELGFVVGDRIVDQPADLLVTGLFEPRDPDDPYFAHTGDLAVPTVDRQVDRAPTFTLSAYVAPGSVAGLQSTMVSGSLTAWVPIDPSRLDYADAGLLQVQARRFGAAQVVLPFQGDLGFRSGLPDAIDVVVDRVTTTSALLALSVSGLLGVLLAVFALCVRSVLARRRTALALASARGAGATQLRALMVLEGLLVALPGAAIALSVAAVLLPVHVGAAGWALPAVVALAVPVLFAALTSPRSVREERTDLRVGARSPVRGVLEAVVVGLAAVSLLLLGRRGLVESSRSVGIDPLLASTPLLLAAAVCVVVLRIYPVPLLALQRRLRRGDSVAGLVGAARAVRDPALGFAAAFALVVGISVVVFSAVMTTTVRAALVQGAQDVVGSDVRVEARLVDPDTLTSIRDLPGVRAGAGLDVEQGVALDDGAGSTLATVVVADTAALHETRPDLPVLGVDTDGRASVLLSSDWADSLLDGDVTVGGLDATVAGTVDVGALPGVTRRWVLVDRAAVPAAPAGVDPGDGVVAHGDRQVLVRLDEGADPARVAERIGALVTAAQPDADAAALVEVTVADAVLTQARSSPAVASLPTVLLVAGLASLALTLLTVVLASLAAAPARNRLLGVLRILGISPGQVRAVLAWELAPVAATAVVVGTALGLLLPWVVTGALDLRPFVGGRSPVRPSVDPWLVLAAVAAFLVVVVAAGLVAVAVGRRVAPAAALKMGEG